MFFRLDRQSWTRQPTKLERGLASFQRWFNAWSSRATDLLCRQHLRRRAADHRMTTESTTDNARAAARAKST